MLLTPHVRPLQVSERGSALLCSECQIAFHATVGCTGLAPAMLAKTQRDSKWRCPSCMVQATGAVTAGALVCEDVSGGTEPVPIPVLNEYDEERLADDYEYTKQVCAYICMYMHICVLYACICIYAYLCTHIQRTRTHVHMRQSTWDRAHGTEHMWDMYLRDLAGAWHMH